MRPGPAASPGQRAELGSHLAQTATRVSGNAGMADLEDKLFPDEPVEQLLRRL